jgi:hypothetical protein
VSLSLAIVFPAVLTVVLLVVQTSLWWYASQAALTAAREGADAGRVRGGTDLAATGRALDFLDRLGTLADPGGPNGVVVDGTKPDTYRVSVTVRPLSLIPGLDRPITRHVELPREKFVPQEAP